MPLFLGNNTYLFVIMGMSTEISGMVGMDIYRDMLQRRLPSNLQLLPYDTLLQRFEAGLPRLYYLVAIQSEEKLPSAIEEQPASGTEEKRLSDTSPIEIYSDNDCILDENGQCINPNQKHWGANE